MNTQANWCPLEVDYSKAIFPAARAWQVKALEGLRAGFRNGHRRQILCAATGSGKTLAALQLLHGSLLKGKYAIFVCDRTALINQTSARADSYGLPHGIVQAEHWRRDTSIPFQICSMQTIAARGYWPRADLIVVDECHSQFKAMGERILSTDAAIIGLTATPCTKGLGKLYTNLVSATTMHELTAEGILVPLKILACVRPDMAGAATSGGEWTARAAGEREATILGDVVGEWLAHGENRKTIAFGADIAYCNELVKRFNGAGIAAQAYTSQTPDADRLELVKEFEKPDSSIKVLASVAALARGFDVPDIGCIIDARPLRRSLSEFIQMCLDSKTEILTRQGWKRCEDVAEEDQCAAFDQRSAAIEWCGVEEKIERSLAPEETMIAYAGNNANLRITDHHDLVVKGRKSSVWRKEAAHKAMLRKELFCVPVAGMMCIPEAHISDDELKFIGWVLTDGTIYRSDTRVTVGIAQSSVHGEYCEEIERVLNACGFRWGRYRSKRYGNEFALARNYADCYHYDICVGRPRRTSDRHLRGCGHLLSWLDKSIPAIFDSLSARQFGVLLGAMFLGDGRKYAKANYISRTLELTCGDNERMADRLQAIAVIRGWRCNKSVHHYNAQPLFNLRLRQRTYITIPGANVADGHVTTKKKPYTRARLSRTPFRRGELVWCVRNRLGTLVTRREGKVVIVGNCGRGLRCFPGKVDCLYLDHSGNSIRFLKDFERVYFEGFKSLDDGEKADRIVRKEPEDHVPKGCPQCGHKPFSRHCLACGFERQSVADTDEQSGVMTEIRIGKRVAASSEHDLWNQLCTQARHSPGIVKKFGWCWYKFQEITGQKPPSSFSFEDAPDVPVTAATIGKLKQLHIRYRHRRAREELHAPE